LILNSSLYWHKWSPKAPPTRPIEQPWSLTMSLMGDNKWARRSKPMVAINDHHRGKKKQRQQSKNPVVRQR
jgi:hypothetical protein